MALGQQPDYGYMDSYTKKKYSPSDDYESQLGNLKDQASMMSKVTEQTGPSTDTGSMMSKEFSQGASRGMSGGLGSALMSGGMASGNPYAMAGGFGVMALEGDAQGRQAEEDAKAKEAQQRKQNQLSAINSLIAVSKGLGV